MEPTLEWTELAWRLFLTAVAGAALGINRTERGRSAGLRTTLLVCLAASVSMIQVNLLLDVRGKTPDSFVMMDMMRLPLGVLTGMGFIGAGAILRKGSLIQGVTTAATLWLATVLGLCFGGGQSGLGLSALAIGLVTLWGLAPLENALSREQRATLALECDAESSAENEIAAALAAGGYHASSHTVAFSMGAAGSRRRTVHWNVNWRAKADAQPPRILAQCSQIAGVSALTWKTLGS